MSELSERSRVARSTISNWDTNRRKPYAKAVNAVADVLGIDRAEAHVLAGIVAPERKSYPGVPDELAETVNRVLRDRPEDIEPVIAAIGRALNPTAPSASPSGRSADRRAG